MKSNGPLLAAVVLALAVAGVEGASRLWSPALRLPLYAGALAGLAVVAAGLPFGYKLTRLEATAQASGAFWFWWGSGFLARLFLLGGLAVVLGVTLRAECSAAILALAGTYLAGLALETWWLAKHFWTGNGSNSRRTS